MLSPMGGVPDGCGDVWRVPPLARRLVAALVGVAVAGTAPGCVARNVTGITVSRERVPMVTNCGTYLTSLEAKDADSGRVVWAARLRRVADSGGAAEIGLGQLPDGG